MARKPIDRNLGRPERIAAPDEMGPDAPATLDAPEFATPQRVINPGHEADFAKQIRRENRRRQKLGLPKLGGAS